MDAISEARLGEVHPKLSELMHKMAEMLKLENIDIHITQALRTWAEQDALYAQGRVNPGKRVTNAKGGESYHNFGLAVDVCPFTPLGQPIWDENQPCWPRLVSVGEALGMFPGAKFSKPDRPHFQLTGRFPESPTDELRSIFRDHGIQGVWDAAQII